MIQKMKHKSIAWRLTGKMFDSRSYEGQTERALVRAWEAYRISDKKNDFERRRYYASVIQKLEQKLGKTVTPFRELKICALEFYNNNPQLFKDCDGQEITGEKVLKIMMENGYQKDEHVICLT